MKKGKLFSLLSLGLLVCGGLGLILSKGPSHALSVKAEDEIIVPETYECSVVIVESQNGTVTADKLEGHVDEVVTLNVKHDVFYLIQSVSVNGTELVQDEEVSGKYTFKLVEGENKIEAKFVINEELLGEMSVIMEQAKNKDWGNLFSVENIIRVVSLLFSSGILLVVVRYYAKDKKLEGKLERYVTKTLTNITPEITKKVATSVIRELIMPIFTEMKVDNTEMKDALVVFSRCLALAQENTPEARLAITKELSSLKLGDQASINAIQSKIEDFVVQQNQNFVNLLEKMKKMEETNKGIVSSGTPSSSTGEEHASESGTTTTHPYE